MKLSWSHKLFLKINEQLGKRPRMDAWMKFFGSKLIWILLFVFFLIFSLRIFEKRLCGHQFEIVVCAFFISYLMSYTIALLFPHERPIKELPHIKNLFPTLSNWKSFPSDHTIAVSLFALLSFEFLGIGWGCLFSVGACLVAAGRVYGGVHYPRDIVGGFLVACLGMVGALPLALFFF